MTLPISRRANQIEFLSSSRTPSSSSSPAVIGNDGSAADHFARYPGNWVMFAKMASSLSIFLRNAASPSSEFYLPRFLDLRLRLSLFLDLPFVSHLPRYLSLSPLRFRPCDTPGPEANEMNRITGPSELISLIDSPSTIHWPPLTNSCRSWGRIFLAVFT